MKNTLLRRLFRRTQSEEILYKDGDKITGKERVLKKEVIARATCHYISDSIFKVSTKGLVLLQDNVKAINAFSKIGHREDSVVKEWPKAEILPNWIYFFKKASPTSSNALENHYEEILPRVELNVLSAFNSRYPEFYKKFPNGIQRKAGEKNFSCAIFRQMYGKSDVNVSRGACGWYDRWWFACGGN